MYLASVTEEDIKNLLTIIGTCCALYTSLRAKLHAKEAKTDAGEAKQIAEEAKAACTYPDCGHTCNNPTEEKPD